MRSSGRWGGLCTGREGATTGQRCGASATLLEWLRDCPAPPPFRNVAHDSEPCASDAERSGRQGADVGGQGGLRAVHAAGGGMRRHRARAGARGPRGDGGSRPGRFDRAGVHACRAAARTSACSAACRSACSADHAAVCSGGRRGACTGAGSSGCRASQHGPSRRGQARTGAQGGIPRAVSACARTQCRARTCTATRRGTAEDASACCGPCEAGRAAAARSEVARDPAQGDEGDRRLHQAHGQEPDR